MAKKKKPKFRDEDWNPSDTCWCSPEDLLKAIIEEGVFAYDLETTGLSPRKDRN